MLRRCAKTSHQDAMLKLDNHNAAAGAAAFKEKMRARNLRSPAKRMFS